MKHRLDALEFEPYEPPPVVEIVPDVESSFTRDFVARYLAGIDFVPSPSQIAALTPPAHANAAHVVQSSGANLPLTTVEKNVSGSYTWAAPEAKPAEYTDFVIPKGTSCFQAIKQILEMGSSTPPLPSSTD